MSENGGGLSYRDAGVDRDVAVTAKRRIAELVASTMTADVVGGPGGFGGLFRLPVGMKNGALVSSADGVGTKLKVAMLARRHDTVGADLVNHCVNDILVEGAKPLFFLDYIGMGQLEAGTVDQIVTGLANGCRSNGCVLIGGETAELPDFYQPGDYDLAGFIVGAVDLDTRPGAHRVQDGDVLIAVAANGFHTNGYSLLRRLLFDRMGLGVNDAFPDMNESVGDVLLRVHRSYGASLRPLLDAGRIHAMAHITGGGIPENLARVIPDALTAHVDRAGWTLPPEFAAIQKYGNVTDDEMMQTFNLGIGMILIVAPEEVRAVVQHLENESLGGWKIGRVQSSAAENSVAAHGRVIIA
jgi:phosphoribosylformylglycinamidine cyclo-ligase